TTTGRPVGWKYCSTRVPTRPRPQTMIGCVMTDVSPRLAWLGRRCYGKGSSAPDLKPAPSRNAADEPRLQGMLLLSREPSQTAELHPAEQTACAQPAVGMRRSR